MLKRKALLIFIMSVVFCAFSISTSTVNAQMKSDDISVITNPKQPGPNETVYASLSSFAVDLNKTLISWSLNGQVVSQGVGQKNFSFKTGASGTQTSVGIKIDATDGSSANKQLILNPTTIDLVWEAIDSYTPPFYKGRTLVSQESAVKVVALLDSTKSAGASYIWKLDGKASEMFSGYGKNSFVFKKSFLDKKNKIEVSASSLINENIGSSSVEINNTNPKILFYKKNPYTGTDWSKALTSPLTIDQNGETIVFEPYFISPKNLYSPDLNIKWELSGSQISTPNTKNELSIKPEKSNGSSVVKVTVENIKSMFLNTSKEINANF
jgi:hypothetical protein